MTKVEKLRSSSTNLFRLYDPASGEFVHFSLLDQRTKKASLAWIGDIEMVGVVRERFPHTQKMAIERIKRG